MFPFSEDRVKGFEMDMTKDQVLPTLRGFIDELDSIVKTADIEDDCRLASIRLEKCEIRLVQFLNASGFREDARIVDNIAHTLKATYGAPQIYSIKEDVGAYKDRLTVLVEEISRTALSAAAVKTIVLPVSFNPKPTQSVVETAIPEKWTDEQRNLVTDLISRAQAQWIYPKEVETVHIALLRLEQQIELILDFRNSEHLELRRELERLIEVVLHGKEKRPLGDFTSALSHAKSLARSVFGNNVTKQGMNVDVVIPSPSSLSKSKMSLSKGGEQAGNAPATAPTCFISYSWDSEEHNEWVRRLATELKKNGVQTRLDQWDVRLGMDLPQYMETSIRESDIVLLVCTPLFALKANKATGGVGYEKTIVTGEIYQGADPCKFTPILRSGTENDALPSYLKSKVYEDFRDDARFQKALERVLRHIFSEPEHSEPALGKKPSFNAIDKPINMGTRRQRRTRNVTSIEL